MCNSDRQIHEILRKKNELESLVYELRQNVSGSHEAFLDDSLRQTIQSQCDQDEDWLYGDGEDTTKSAYQAKLDHLQKLARPVYQRFQEFQLLPDYFSALNNALLEAEKELAKQDDKLKHITPEDRQPGLTLLAESRAWMLQMQQALAAASKLQSPPVTCAQINEKLSALVNSVKAIMSKPEPKKEEPKKEEEKKEEEKK